MNADVLIIGQGLCGTFLHWYLSKEGLKCVVADPGDRNGASQVAAGIINPVTGRRIVQTWMIDELMPFAYNAYKKLEQELNAELIAQTSIVDFFPSAQMRQAFLERVADKAAYLSLPPDENIFREHFHYDLGCGIVSPAYLVQPAVLLNAYRQKLKQSGELLEEPIDEELVKSTNSHWLYKHLLTRFVLFCDGIQSYQSNFFKNLPFAPNKGEVLYIEAEGLPDKHVFKKGMNLVPVQKNIFWVGSSYEWEFENDQPSAAFLNRTVNLLSNWLKTPFKIIDHRAAVRPATIERRPFAGMHPDHPTLGILNGMGTKGCTLAPYFASQLCRHITKGDAILPEAEIHRYRNLMSRKLSENNPDV